jgi:hypothetical protein
MNDKIVNENIKSYFFLDKKEYDGIIHISMEGCDAELLELIMNKIYFELCPNQFEFKAYPPNPNNNFLERKIYFRKNK